VAGLFEAYPFYQPYEIAAGTYPDQTSPVKVINDPATIFTSEGADEGLINAITSTIFEHLPELGEVHPQAKAIALETATQTPIDLHPGAKAFFDQAR